MISAQEYINAAIAELREPSEDGTKEALKHGYEIDFQNPILRPSSEKYRWELVHFPLTGMKFTLGVAMSEREDGRTINIVGAFFLPRIYLYLTIASETLSAENITDRLRLTPTRIDVKGQPKSGRSKAVNTEHGWFLDYKSEMVDLDDGVGTFLPLLMQRSEEIRSLAVDCYVGLQAVIYDGPNWQLSTLHLTREQMEAMSKMGIEFDVDHYLGL